MEKDITVRSLAVQMDIPAGTRVSKLVGNTTREIAVRSATVIYRGPRCYVDFHGPQLRRDGTHGSPRDVGWYLAPERDSGCPLVALDLERRARAVLLTAGSIVVEVP